ncbi:DUF748 domain-containing protein [Allomuricauda taeanensis]|uniref:DUF748 domain-containing protein n=1 Tax=Flagellimonas taeanensis TaxID=1005926 RepID=UPI002E7C4264|nr:DUF748 domain-containing protein [Allomuricauda taeanensis]MEE1961071.1 DUF748 domain-containing protein [Allomuricauda taeanensis]
MTKQRKKVYKRKRYLLPAILIVLLIAFRIALPYIVKNYVNKVLADIPGYYGQVEDIDLSLITGAYTIDHLYLNKVNAGSQIPFLDFEKTNISIEWSSLLKGKVVSEINMTRPTVIYVFEDQQKESEGDADIDDWSKALTDLVPIDINKLEIHGGKMAFVQLTADPNIDLHLDQIELYATNLRNVVRTEARLPSNLSADAISIGGGNLHLEGQMDLVKQIPDMDLALSLENANATALNDFTDHYAGIDFDKGTFNLYSELAIADGYLKGYLKPILKDTKLIGKEDAFLDVLWEGFVGFFKFVLKNHKQNTLATKVPIEGDLNDVKTKTWPTVTNIFKNAWIKAFKGIVDNDIEFENVQETAKSKKDEKKKDKN